MGGVREESEEKGGGNVIRERRTGCVPVERVAAGQISVTPKSSWLKGPRGGRRAEQ